MKKFCLAIAAGLALGHSVAALAEAPQALVAKKAAILSSLHKKAEKALVNAAQDTSYTSFLEATEAAARASAKERLEKVSLSVQEKFHVEEMCLIDADGPELARIVGDKIANDLSPDESGAVFFKPGFAQKPRTVYISPLYVSPDADKWVLAYVTPIVTASGKKAILHYEHGLDTYQGALNKDLSGNDQFVVAVTPDGWVVSDSRQPIAVAKSGEKEEAADYFQKFSFGALGLAEVVKALDSGGTVTDAAGNQFTGAQKQVEHWTVMAFQKK